MHMIAIIVNRLTRIVPCYTCLKLRSSASPNLQRVTSYHHVINLTDWTRS
jgi:hypothetical protein